MGLTEHAATRSLRAAGFCSLTVRAVIGFPQGLSLIQDEVDHAEIRGVPLMKEDEQRALDIADYLVSVAISAVGG